MSLAKYIWRNCKRNRLRSLLTAMSIAVGAALVTLLYGALAIQDVWCQNVEQYSRIVVMSNQGVFGTVPIAHLSKVRALAGIHSAVPFTWFGGNYQGRKNPFAQFATDADATLAVWSEFTLPPTDFEQWKKTRSGCIVGRQLAARWNWQVGQRITLEGQYYPFDLHLELSGIFDSPRYSNSLLFHWEYLDEEIRKFAPDRSGNAGFIYAKVNDSHQIATISAAIDTAFSNTAAPTTSQSESAFSLMFVDMIGDVRRLIQMVSLTVAICLMTVTANSIAMSTRDRRSEFAILRAIGFSSFRVFMMVVGEATLLAMLGCLAGQGLAIGLLELLHQANQRMFPVGVDNILGAWLAVILVLAILQGAISALVPAVIAARSRIIDAIRAV